MDRRTFDDVTVGETIDCGTNSVTREDVLAFGEAFDPLGMHTDADAAAESPFGGLIASGIHTLALTQPPVVERFYADSDLVASRGFESVRLPAPVRPGDTLHVFLDVLDKYVADSGRGVVTTRRRAAADDERVLEMTNQTVWEH